MTTDYLPCLDGVLDVSPPSVTLSDLRHVIPSPEAVARFRSILGAGRRVTVRGEMRKHNLLAYSITDENGDLGL